MQYLAIDVQMVIGGKQYEIGPEDYVFGATQLFIDIIYIFWMILTLVGGASRLVSLHVVVYLSFRLLCITSNTFAEADTRRLSSLQAL